MPCRDDRRATSGPLAELRPLPAEDGGRATPIRPMWDIGRHTPEGELLLNVVVALGGALAATGRAAASSRSRRVLLRVGGGSTASLRLFAACRAGLSAACGTGMGATAGCAIGLLLVWPMTVSIDWEPVPRVPFETPWSWISALVVGLPFVAAVVAGLCSPGMTTRSVPRR